MFDWTALLPPGIDAATLAALMAASFGGSFVTAAFGIGGGVLLLGILAVLMPPAALIPVHGVVQMGSNLGRAGLFLRHMVWRVLPWFAAGSVLGVALGGSIVTALPPWLVQLGVGLFIVWSVMARPPRWLLHWPVVTGAISSFLTMFFGATGPFVATYVKSLGMTRHPYVATHATLMVVQHLLKTLTFGLLGFAYGPWIAFIAAMIGAGFLGTLVGRQVLNRLSDGAFDTALNVLLLLIAARLIWSGLIWSGLAAAL